MDHYNLLTIPGSELFAKIGEINAIANDNTSDEQETAINALNNLSTILEKRSGSREESLVAPGQVLFVWNGVLAPHSTPGLMPHSNGKSYRTKGSAFQIMGISHCKGGRATGSQRTRSRQVFRSPSARPLIQ